MLNKVDSRVAVLLAMLIAGLACVTTLPVTLAPQPAVLVTATLSPTSTPTVTPFPGIERQYRAMRPGYKADVDDHAGGAHYWLELALDEDPVRMSGREHVHYVNTTGDTLDDVVFRVSLNALAELRVVEVSNVTTNGQPGQAEWLVRNSALRVPLAVQLVPGESVEVEMDFNLTLPDFEISYGRISNQDGVIVLSAFFPLLSVYEQDGWWTTWPEQMGDPAYSEVALFDVKLTAPADLQVASTGVTLESVDHGDGTATHTIASGSVRDFTLTLSRDFELSTATWSGVTINIWSAPGNEEADAYALDKTQAALDIYDEQFGAYPLGELDVVEAPITAGGIEYPGLVYIAHNLWDTEADYFEFVLVHEIAHQWWYGMVGNNQVEQPWLDEGLADYSIEVYYREAYGLEAGKNVRDYYQEDLGNYLKSGGSQMPVGLPVSAYTGIQYGVFVYSSGALLYSHLYDECGANQVRELLRAYYAQYRYGIAHSEDMGRMVEELCGANSKAFFDEWVYGG